METKADAMNEETSKSQWYNRFLTLWSKNGNRVGPGQVELPDCDFFIVGPRRTLRVLHPSPKSAVYYNTPSHRPDSINDNFFTRWSRRPHSSGSCRCSLRSSRPSTKEECLINAELNHIRNSLCEAEKSGQDSIEELEKRVSMNLQKLHDSAKYVPNEDQLAKGKIVEDLEKYINGLLEEILDDTVKYISETDDIKSLKEDVEYSQPSTMRHEIETVSSTNMNFVFPVRKRVKYCHPSYANPGFVGSINDPDTLDFYVQEDEELYSSLEPQECVDSGINSVETIEFQPEEISLEQSLMTMIDEKLGRIPCNDDWKENHLQEIIESKINPTSRKKVDENDISRNILDTAIVEKMIEPADNESSSQKIKLELIKTSNYNNNDTAVKTCSLKTKMCAQMSFFRRRFSAKLGSCKISEINHPVTHPVKISHQSNYNEKSFILQEKITAEFRSEPRNKILGTKSVLTKPSRDKIVKSAKMKNNDSNKEATGIEPKSYEEMDPIDDVQNQQDLVMLRRSKKPIIVFLHGFGASAEIFENQLRYFSALGYSCIAPDMLGHGMSSAPRRAKDYEFNILLKDLDAVFHHYAFKPNQKCVIVAHNYGCSFAAALACKYDSNIHQLVLISGGGPTPLAPPGSESASHCVLRAVLAPLLMCGLHRDILYSARGRQHPYCGAECPTGWPPQMNFVLKGMVWPEGDYLFHRRICTPTLLIHGLKDSKVSLVQECQMERTMVKAYLEAIPSAGHCPMTDCPDQLNHMIHCFIDLWKHKKR